MMNKLKLKKLSLLNFRGIKNLQIDFGDTTCIYGANGTGKTSVYNAFLWLLFGKDDEDRLNFNLFDNRLNFTPENATICEVKAVIYFNEREIKLLRTAQQKWVKKHGTTKLERNNDTYEYFIDDIPRSATEYKDFIASILDEKIFKIVTNNSFFASLHWTEKRDILHGIVGPIKDENLQGDYSELLPLLAKMSKEDILAQCRSKAKPIRDQIKAIPISIKTLESQTATDINFAEVEAKRNELRSVIADIDKELSGEGANIQPFINRRNKEQGIINDKVRTLSELEKDFVKKQDDSLNDLKNQLAEIERKNANIKEDNERLQKSRNELTETKAKLQKELTQLYNNRNILYEKYNKAVEKVFDKDKNCPTCKRKLAFEDIEQMELEFNANKKTEIDGIIAEGREIKTSIESIEGKIESLDEQISAELVFASLLSKEAIKEQIEAIRNSFVNYCDTEEYKAKVTEIETLRNNLTVIPIFDNSLLTDKKKEKQIEVDKCTELLAKRDSIAEIKVKIKELHNELQAMNIELVNVEKIENSLMEYEREKASLMQEKINSLFNICNIEVLDTDKKGNFVDTCEITDLNGVKYSTLNNAAKQIIGLDIIHVLSDYYGVKCPVFIDNAESINKVPEQQTQVICTYVTEDKTLRIVNQ